MATRYKILTEKDKQWSDITGGIQYDDGKVIVGGNSSATEALAVEDDFSVSKGVNTYDDATGGTITHEDVDGVTYSIHTFNSDGTFANNKARDVEYLVVGGGGAGGTWCGGAGGAGGVLDGTITGLSTGNKTVTVGDGGAQPSSNADGASGEDSVFSTPNLFTGGTPSADTEYSGSYVATNAVDGNIATLWVSNDTALPHWWKYDLGAGNAKAITYLEINTYYDVSGNLLKDSDIQGSNNNSDWTTISSKTAADSANQAWQTFSFTNTTAYRYYRLNCTTNYRADTEAGFNEIKGYESIKITAHGGGGGAGYNRAGVNGGSGGGGAHNTGNAGGTGITGEGYAGGYGGGSADGGGGGGASEVGASGSTTSKGGDGVESSITGTATYYGGGGGGFKNVSNANIALGGAGGGGKGGSSLDAGGNLDGEPGTDGLGGGGGGGHYADYTMFGGKGGNGVVILRYPSEFTTIYENTFYVDDTGKVEIKNLTSGFIPVATTDSQLVDITPQAHETALKVDYTTGDLDTEAEVIAAVNATNTTVNSIITKLESLKLFANS